MALMTRSRPAQPRRQGGKHARRTPLRQQLRRKKKTKAAPAAPLMNPPVPAAVRTAASRTPQMSQVCAEGLHTQCQGHGINGPCECPSHGWSPYDARLVVEALFAPSEPGIERPDGLYPLDWQYGYGSATAQVAPALLPDAARNVVLAYANRMAAGFLQEEIGGRHRIRTARAYAGVTVAVWADVTPDPTVELIPPAPAEPEPELPIEHLAREACLTAQAFDSVTDEAEGPGHPDSDPDGGEQKREPEGPSREPAEPLPTAATAAITDDTPIPADADEQNQDTAA